MRPSTARPATVSAALSGRVPVVAQPPGRVSDAHAALERDPALGAGRDSVGGRRTGLAAGCGGRGARGRGLLDGDLRAAVLVTPPRGRVARSWLPRAEPPREDAMGADSPPHEIA